MSEKLVLVLDSIGRYIFGKFEYCNDHDKEITIKDPLLIIERTVQTQNSSQQIMMNISPLFHTFNIDTWTFKYVGYHSITDEKMISAYEKFQSQVRAARSGIQVAHSLPAQQNAVCS